MAFQRLRGFRDITGADALAFERVEAAARAVFGRFGFEEIRIPLLEEKQLFSRALGTETDVVQKEMYEFDDRSGVRVALRPEGTAGVVRAYLENNFDKTHGWTKLYYLGPMFRSERPQAGRLRQFHQIGVEQLGTDSPYADAETVHCLSVFLDEAGASGYAIKLNNLGTFEERQLFRRELEGYFAPLKDRLCEDCRARLGRNVFRLLDCKQEGCRALARSSPPIDGFLTDESRRHHETVLAALGRAGVAVARDPYLVRGLDYYTRTVFEVTHPSLGAQDALGAGGRYDSLVESFGGARAGSVGFAVGLERLVMCLSADGAPAPEPPVFVVTLGPAAAEKGFELVSTLRRAGVRASMEYGAKSMKSQLRAADKHRCRFAVILGDDELAQGVFVMKHFETGEQKTFPLDSIVERCRKQSLTD